MEYTRETPISSDRAREILEAAGDASPFDSYADWYISTTAEGGEYLTMGGYDEPIALNHTNTSWMSPGKIEGAKCYQQG